MKKVFLTLALAAFAFAANAQFVISGNLGFSHSGEKYTYDGKDEYFSNPVKSNDFNLTLKAGYQINDNLQAGLLLGYSTSSDVTEMANPTDFTSTDRNTTNKGNTINLGVYGRYNITSFGDLNLFAEGTVRIAMGSGKNETEFPGGSTSVDAPKTFGLGIDIVPGVSYQLTDNLSAELYFDFVSLGFHSNKTTWDKNITTSGVEETYTRSNFGLGVNGLGSALSVGVTYKF